MDLASKIVEKNESQRKSKEKKNNIEDIVVEKLEDEGYPVVGANADSSLVEFSVLFNRLIERRMLENLDELFDDFRYTSITVKQDYDGSPVIEVFLEKK
jgi:hypothetical protein